MVHVTIILAKALQAVLVATLMDAQIIIARRERLATQKLGSAQLSLANFVRPTRCVSFTAHQETSAQTRPLIVCIPMALLCLKAAPLVRIVIQDAAA